MTPEEKKIYYNNLIQTQYNGKASMDSIIPYVEFDGGYWVYSNHQEVIHTDMNGIKTTSYLADVEWKENI
jgi:hypothetical protein